MNIDEKLQGWLKSHLTLEDALPTKMPVYVNSMAYFFGTMTLSALVVVIGSGIIIAIFGPGWWHVSPMGHFFNSVHFWGVEIFYFGLVLHMLAKFFKAAWRDGRWRTWVMGLMTFAVTIFSGITGTLLQQNWDAQWNAVQGKDPMNALGLAWINTMDPGQLLTLHVVLFPFLVVLFAAIHIGIVRSESPVRPIERGSKEEAR
ncbi:cytochrome b/b6 domain protein [mine drainage metagenome]|uniref:Cytochrome b/b6 domain protein n=1 Tax=mine drainage metagenome TaxID=410659 RepID=T0ZZU4_9ZZZZ